jgi:hypothetical protein
MRRLIAVAGLACVLSLWAGKTVSAADGGKKGGANAPGKGRSEEMRERLRKQFDKDGDGKLNEEERKAAREAFQSKPQGGQKGPGLKRPRGIGQKGPGKNGPGPKGTRGAK